jgi:hypothetical protein
VYVRDWPPDEGADGAVEELPLRTSEKSALPLVPFPPLPKRLSKTPIVTSRIEWQAGR